VASTARDDGLLLQRLPDRQPEHIETDVAAEQRIGLAE
jgi:hypothetical protein